MKSTILKRGLVLLGLLGIVGLTSCEDIVSVHLAESEPRLVVDGWITDQPGPYRVRLTTTAPYFSNQAAPLVSGARVTLADEWGVRAVLSEKSPGLYETETLRGRIGGEYTLSVNLKGEEYTAFARINRVPGIDSIGYVYREETDDRDAGYFLTYYGPELPGGHDYYRIKVFRNDTLLNNPELDLFYFSDAHADGLYLNGLELSAGPFQKGDTARVEMHSITEETYRFLVELQRQMRNDGLFAGPMANVSTNIRSAATNPKPATGWFGGSAVQTKVLLIR